MNLRTHTNFDMMKHYAFSPQTAAQTLNILKNTKKHILKDIAYTSTAHTYTHSVAQRIDNHNHSLIYTHHYD